MRPLVVLAAVLAGGSLLVGCGPNCQSSCYKIWAPSECGKAIPGYEWGEMYDRCMNTCESAMKRPGEVDDYDPDERGVGQNVQLDNERKAAMWMECVEESACSRIIDGYCAPHF